MDVIVLLVVVGCAVAGLIWGALRMVTAVAAVAAAILAGRLVGPAAAALLPAMDGGHERILGTVLAAAVAVVLVLVAGRGLRRGLEALKLGWIDRVAGGVLAAGGAVAVLAVLLALAAAGGNAPSSPWALGLAGAGQAMLALHGPPASSARPSSSPPSATSKGQQPH